MKIMKMSKVSNILCLSSALQKQDMDSMIWRYSVCVWERERRRGWRLRVTKECLVVVVQWVLFTHTHKLYTLNVQSITSVVTHSLGQRDEYHHRKRTQTVKTQQQHRQTKSKHQKHKSNNNKWFYLRLILWVIVSKRNSSFSCDHTNIIRAQNDYSVQPQPHTHICITTQTNSTSTRFDGSEDIVEHVVIILTPSDRYIIESVRLFFDFKNLIFL